MNWGFNPQPPNNCNPAYDRYLAGGMDALATSCLSINLQVQVQVRYVMFISDMPEIKRRPTVTT